MGATTMTIAAATPRRIRGDEEFLPAALEILETPASPVRASLTAGTAAFMAAALAWSWFGCVDVVATARGKVQAVGRTRVVEAEYGGRVAWVGAPDGTRVSAGEVMVRLDRTQDEAAVALARREEGAASAEAARRIAAADAAHERRFAASPAYPGGTEPAVAARETAALRADLASLAASVAGLAADARGKVAARDRAAAVAAAQGELVATLGERVAMRTTLAKGGAASRAQVIDALEAMQGQAATLASERGALGEADAASARVARDLERTYATFEATQAQAAADAGRRADEAAGRLAGAMARLAATELRAPVDGIVSGSAATGPGQVVGAGQPVVEVVPVDAGLEVEAYLPNGDAGFVRAGQAAVVKVDAYPSTDHGSLDATVSRVGADAVPTPDAERRAADPTAPSGRAGYGGAQATGGLAFPLTVALPRSSVRADGGDRLSPGMAVDVEVRTGSRRILSYLLSPVAATVGEAFRER